MVEKNELAIDEELLLKEKQSEKKHLNRQVSFVERPSIATSQLWIDAEYGEITLLIGEEKIKFDLHQSKPLTGEEMRACKKLESSFLLIEEQAPKILQEDTLEGHKFEANSFPTKELAFEILTPILEVEKVILTSDEDEEGVLATMDGGPKRRSRTSLMSLAGL